MRRHSRSILCEWNWLVFLPRKEREEIYAHAREGERTVLQRRDTLKGHAKVVWVQESCGVIEELHILRIPTNE